MSDSKIEVSARTTLTCSYSDSPDFCGSTSFSGIRSCIVKKLTTYQLCADLLLDLLQVHYLIDGASVIVYWLVHFHMCDVGGGILWRT